MRERLLRSARGARLVALVASAACNDAPPAQPPPRAEEMPPLNVSAHPVGWPYWVEAPISIAHGVAPTALPLAAKDVEMPAGAASVWSSLDPAVKERLLATGVATVHTSPRAFSVGDLYLAQQCAGVPTLVTVDALMALTFLATEAALADAEVRMSATVPTVLRRLDAHLAAAEPGAHPDLLAGLHMAEGVVAVGLSLLDTTYVAPAEVKGVVATELSLLRAHAGRTTSPLLHVPLDYAAFSRRGAVSDATAAQFLAAQWLSLASFAFDAAETTSHVDMSAARARARGALLLARLFLPSRDDTSVRAPLLTLDRAGELALGDPEAASPLVLARLALDHGFDPHDATAIGDPVALDRLRRVAATQLGAMELFPLRRVPDQSAFLAPSKGDAGVDPQGSDVVAWLRSSAWTSSAATHHASFYASGLDALSTWLGPSLADGGVVAAATPGWSERKARGALAAWAILRHGTVPFARVRAHDAPAPAGSPACSPSSLVVIEPHPEAIASLLGFTRQVSSGLLALGVTDEAAPSRELLADMETTLAVAASALEGSGRPGAEAPEIDALPSRIAKIEARIAPGAGPFAATVLTDPAKTRALVVGTAGLDTLYTVVRDPRTGHLTLAVGASLAESEQWEAASVEMTDREWATTLAGRSTARP
jgi:hypothetical protein